MWISKKNWTAVMEKILNHKLDLLEYKSRTEKAERVNRVVVEKARRILNKKVLYEASLMHIQHCFGNKVQGKCPVCSVKLPHDGD